MTVQDIKQRFSIIGKSPLLERAISMAAQVAPTDISVLITGESGVGKEAFSHIIHSLSRRKSETFIAVNCGALPEGTINSELFGHEKGAFTGAADARKGWFETVNGGTIFLDEVGEMPLETQARLLRVLESGEIIRVGSSKPLKTNVRVVAATNVDLLGAVENGKFREDLYYRLNTVNIRVPSLRERPEDIHLLFRKFSSDFSEKYHTQPAVLDTSAQDVLRTFTWPGNVRQLRNLAEQLCIMESGNTLDSSRLLEFLPKDQPRTTLPAVIQAKGAPSVSEREIMLQFLYDMKRDLSELTRVVAGIVQKVGSVDAPNVEFTEPHRQTWAPSMANYEEPREILTPNSNFSRPTGNGITYDSYEANALGNQRVQPEIILTPRSSFQPSNRPTPTPSGNGIRREEHIEDVQETLSLADQERRSIVKSLEKHRGRRREAAKELGISERTLYRKIKEYDLQE